MYGKNDRLNRDAVFWWWVGRAKEQSIRLGPDLPMGRGKFGRKWGGTM